MQLSWRVNNEHSKKCRFSEMGHTAEHRYFLQHKTGDINIKQNNHSSSFLAKELRFDQSYIYTIGKPLLKRRKKKD
jgi:hypothetical protein